MISHFGISDKLCQSEATKEREEEGGREGWEEKVIVRKSRKEI